MTGQSIMGAPELSDGVVFLRMMTLSDAEAHFANEDDLTVRYFGGRSTMDSTTRAIEESQRSWESGGEWKNLGIWEIATNTLVGFVDANLAAPGYKAGVANISYNIQPAARGRGFVPRAVILLTRYLAGQASVETAVIQFDPENHSSERVAQKAGFKQLGERTGADGKRMIVYGLPLRPRLSELTLTDVCGGSTTTNQDDQNQAVF